MVVQLATNTVQITMCVQTQRAFLKVEILNGFKWSVSRRVNLDNSLVNNGPPVAHVTQREKQKP